MDEIDESRSRRKAQSSFEPLDIRFSRNRFRNADLLLNEGDNGDVGDKELQLFFL